MTRPNVRVAKPRPGLTPEIAGQFFVQPEEWPNSAKADRIRKLLAECQQEEPGEGWRLEFRGTHRDWHPEENA